MTSNRLLNRLSKLLNGFDRTKLNRKLTQSERNKGRKSAENKDWQSEYELRERRCISVSEKEYSLSLLMRVLPKPVEG